MTTKPSLNMIAGLSSLLDSALTFKGVAPANLSDALETGIYILEGTTHINTPANTVTANTRSVLVVFDLGMYKSQVVFPYGSTNVMASRTGVTNSSTGATSFTGWSKPATSGHSHTAATTAADGFMSAADKTKLDNLSKASVGLGNVDNTSDVNKPVSTATQTALDTKLDKTGGQLGFLSLTEIPANWQLRFDATVTLASGTVYNFTPGSGLMVTNDHSTGDVGLFVVGGSGVTKIGQTGSIWGGPSETSKLRVQYSVASNSYYVGNETGESHVISFAAIRTRAFA